MAHSLRTFGLALAAGLLAGCEATSPKPSIPQVPSILHVNVDPGTATISRGGTVRFAANVTTNPTGGAYSVTWTTSDAAAVSIDSTGLAVGLAPAPGVSICATVTTGNASAGVKSCATLVVDTFPVCFGPDGTLVPSGDAIRVGDVAQYQIPAAQLAGRSSSEIRWTVDYPAVATIDSLTGRVTGVSVGTSDVIATDQLSTSPCPHVWKGTVVVY